MIRYRLRCGRCDHRFEAWFASADAFEDQASRGLLTCAECASPDIAKALMAPSLRTGRKTETEATPETSAPPGPAAPPSAVPQPNAAQRAALRSALHKMKAHAEAVCEDLGTGFAAEARRIEEGEASARPIRGQATAREVEALHEDGIEVFTLPDLDTDA